MNSAELNAYKSRPLYRLTRWLCPEPTKHLHHGWEPDPEMEPEPYPTRRQCTMLVLAHHVWLEVLREANAAPDGRIIDGKCIINMDIQQCETELQAAELLARAWFETALSITTCGISTGMPAHVIGEIARVHGAEVAAGARAVVGEVSGRVRERLNRSGFSVPTPERAGFVLEYAEKLATASLRAAAD